MGAIGQFDSELQMFRDAPREPDLDRLRFLRWLAEQGKLEHEVFGPPTGRLSVAASPATRVAPGDS